MRTRGAWRKWVVTSACLIAWAGMPGGAAAQEVEIEHDARLEGYGQDAAVVLEEGNSAMTWLAFGVCSVIALLGLFKDAKRSHLD